jgi:hypothetical protein
MHLTNSLTSFKTFLILLALKFYPIALNYSLILAKITSNINNLSFSARDSVVRQVTG